MIEPAFDREYGSQYAIVGLKRLVNHVTLTALIPQLTKDSRLLILDHIQDPHNMGALIRSAASFDYTAVIYPADRQCPITDSVIRASAEATTHSTLCEVPNIATSLRALSKQGLWVYGAMVSGQPIKTWQPVLPYALVVGHEHTGISPVVAKTLDAAIAITTPGKTASLNVSVAGSIMMHWASTKI